MNAKLEGELLIIERLSLNPKMETIIVKQEGLSYDKLIVAAGAHSPQLLEDLGIYQSLPIHYR
ncbi:MAG: hypothetical protein R2865_08975 [Deinococcales bacterium]